MHQSSLYPIQNTKHYILYLLMLFCEKRLQIQTVNKPKQTRGLQDSGISDFTTITTKQDKTNSKIKLIIQVKQQWRKTY